MVPAYCDHLGLWAEELREWVPQRIFDAHVHLGPAEAMGPISPERRGEGLCAFTSVLWEDLAGFYERLYAGREVVGLIAFPLPLREVDLEAANAYLVALMRREPRVRAFLLSHPTETRRAVACYEESQRAGVPFRGVKPYFDLLGKSNYETTMPEFLPDDLLEFMDSEGLAMTLHTSGIGVGDPENQRFLRRLATRYPRIRVVLAHMGRFLQPGQFFDFMDAGVLEECPSLYLDTSWVVLPEVFQRLLERRALWDRLLFGSDIPWGFLVAVEGWTPERGPHFITREDRGAGQGIPALTFNTYHCIHALKEAFERLGIAGGEAEALKEAIFTGNALEHVLGETT